MKRLHIIHHQTINDIDLKSKGKLMALLEAETLDWAKANKTEAYALTLPIQLAYQKNPNSETNQKYFKYLRRLLELKLHALEDASSKTATKSKEGVALSPELVTLLKIESPIIPEYVSCTQLGLFGLDEDKKGCSRRWYYAYGLRLPTPVTAPLHFGKSIDDSFNFYFDEKIKGITPPRQAVYAAFYEAFENGKDKVEWGEEDPKHLLKIGPAVIDAYLDRFDPITKAVDTQTECNVHLDNGGRILGYIDILEKDAIVDTKTAAKFWDDTGKYAKHKQESQPLAYSLWYLETYEKMPKEFRYQIVTKPKEGGKPETQLISFELKKFEVEAFKRKVQVVWDKIMAALPLGIKGFPAQAEKEKPYPLCSQEWCPFAKNCIENGLRVPLKWVSKTSTVPGHHVYDSDVEPAKK
jgi:hypothetical protein